MIARYAGVLALIAASFPICIAGRCAVPDFPGESQPDPNSIKADKLDLFGDPLPPGAIYRAGTLRFRESSAITSIQFSPDGRTIGSINSEGDLSIWDNANGKKIKILSSAGRKLVTFAFSPNGKIVATATTRGFVILINLETGENTQLPEERGVPPSGRALAFSPDGGTLAVGTGISTGAIELWNVKERKRLVKIGTDQGKLMCLVFSPDGNSLASGDSHGITKIWPILDPKKPPKALGQRQREKVYSVGFAANGKTLLSDRSSGLYLWDIETGQTVWENDQYGTASAPTSTADLVAAVNNSDKSVGVFELSNRKEVFRTASIESVVNAVAVSPDGRLLAVGSRSGIIHVFDLILQRPITPFDGKDGEVGSPRFGPPPFVLTTFSSTSINAWKSQGPPQVSALQEPVGARTVSPDARLVAWGTHYGSDRWTFRVLETTSGEVQPLNWPRNVLPQKPSASRTARLSFSPTGQALAIAYWSSTIDFWEVKSRKLKESLKLPVANYSQFAFSGPSEGLYVGTYDGNVFAIGPPDNRKVTIVRQSSSAPGSAILSSLSGALDGRVLAVTFYGSRTEIWDTALATKLCTIPLNTRGAYFSPCGRYFAVMDDTTFHIHLFETASLSEFFVLKGHSGYVTSLVYHPQSPLLVSAATDHTALIWDISKLSGLHKDLPKLPAKDSITAAELQRAWTDLDSPDAKKGYTALMTLVAAGDQAVTFLREHVTPVPKKDLKAIADAIKDLDSSVFSVRKRAFVLLKTWGPLIDEELTEAAKTHPSLEVRSRCNLLLDHVRKQSVLARHLRELRALWALDWIGSASSLRFLTDLSTGEPSALLTREALQTSIRVERILSKK